MKPTGQDDPTPHEDATPPEVRPEEPSGLLQGAASTAPDDPEHQTPEEPGYGHGV